MQATVTGKYFLEERFANFISAMMNVIGRSFQIVGPEAATFTALVR